jgi:alpha-galactosidase
MTSRRDFVRAGFAGAGLVPALSRNALVGAAPVAALSRNAQIPTGITDIHRPPDSVTVQTADAFISLSAQGNGRWSAAGLSVRWIERGDASGITLAADVGVQRIHLRWRGSMAAARLMLGDAWERGYGDLEWRGMVPDRAMPWYCAAWDGQRTHAYGVRTGARAFCFWRTDPDGISLWADVRSGASPIMLGDRTLDVCDIISRAGRAGETSFAAIHAFCRAMCPAPRVPAQPVYGHNDWYWAYGANSAASVIDDARRIVELSPTGTNRPYAVIDDGWQPGRGASHDGSGTWDRGNDKFPDMADLAAAVRRAGARPGIWIRPLEAPSDAPAAWKFPRDRGMLDPTVPEVRQKVAEDCARLVRWGYELIKHDYSTFDIFGRWGFQMGTALTRDGWTFREGPRRTSAEVIDELYRTIREAAGETPIIGCNTVSHLSAGRFEMCRTGDDTSGEDWDRTRKMGVNTLAFRGPQHGAFYAADPDCVPLTSKVPWSMNKQWLDVVARSGTMTFVSLAADAVGAEQRTALREALAIAARPQPLGEPLDWQRTTCPSRWRLMGREHHYHWMGSVGSDGP